MSPSMVSTQASIADLIRSPAGWAAPTATPQYSIVTLVSNHAQYDAMRASFEAGGFGRAGCEYLYIDNSDYNAADAYAGLNALLNRARAPYVLLCHQDLMLIGDGRAELDERLADLDARDANWALAGNAGGVAPGKLALRISDPHASDVRVGTLPARVTSLDENFIVVRRDARLGFSRDLAGFHFYGADICMHAAQMGYSAYVINFHLKHLSAGRKSADFHEMELAFQAKWARALAPRWIQTTCALLRLSGAPVGGMIGRLARVPLQKVVRRLPGAQGWTPSARKPV